MKDTKKKHFKHLEDVFLDNEKEVEAETEEAFREMLSYKDTDDSTAGLKQVRVMADQSVKALTLTETELSYDDLKELVRVLKPNGKISINPSANNGTAKRTQLSFPAIGIGGRGRPRKYDSPEEAKEANRQKQREYQRLRMLDPVIKAERAAYNKKYQAKHKRLGKRAG